MTTLALKIFFENKFHFDFINTYKYKHLFIIYFPNLLKYIYILIFQNLSLKSIKERESEREKRGRGQKMGDGIFNAHSHQRVIKIHRVFIIGQSLHHPHRSTPSPPTPSSPSASQPPNSTGVVLYSNLYIFVASVSMCV